MDIIKLLKKYKIIIIILIIILIIFYIIKNKKKKNLFMCYNDKSKIPQKVYDNAKKYTPDYELLIYDDNEIIQFFKDHYSDSERYINLFNKLQGAHKADLWRYCVLYHYGGVYLDVKTELIKPLNEIFVDDNKLYTVYDFRNNITLFQSIISSPPKNPIFLDLIDHILNISDNYEYHAFTRDFYNKINDYCGDVKLGLNKNLKNDIDIYLFYELCSPNTENIDIEVLDTDISNFGKLTNKSNEIYKINKEKLVRYKCDALDKYGTCCYVYDKGNPIIKSRFDDFGKGW